YPLFEIARIPHRKQTRFQPGKDTQSRFDDTELHQCFERLERIRVKFAVIENARRTWPHEHVIRQNLRPQIFYSFGLRKETVAADVKMETVVSHGPGDTTHVNRVRFENDDVHVFLRKKIARSQTCWTGTDNGDFCFHLLLRDPVAPSEI